MNSLPKGWRLVELDALKARGASSLIGGPFGSDLTQRDYVAEPGVPVIRGSNLDGKNSRFIDDGFVYVSARKALQLTRNLAFPGDLIFTQRGTLGQVAVIPQGARFKRYVISQSQMKLTPDETAVDRNYLYYYFRAPRTIQRLLAETQATGVPHINLGILKRFRVALPPLSEQRRIAEILDKADALRTKRRAALAQLDTLTQSIFLAMFGDPATNPNQWTKVTLGEVATFVGGGTPSRDNPQFFTGSICWATSKDMQSEFLDDTEEHITEEAIKKSATKLVPAGTILIVVKSKVLAHRLPVAVARVATCFGQDLKGVQIGSRCEVSFVAASLRIGSKLLLKSARGINTEGLTLEHLRAFPLVLPPRELQREFARRMDAVLSIKAKILASLEQLESVFASLQHRAFRGEL